MLLNALFWRFKLLSLMTLIQAPCAPSFILDMVFSPLRPDDG